MNGSKCGYQQWLALLVALQMVEEYLAHCRTYMVDPFVKIVNAFK